MPTATIPTAHETASLNGILLADKDTATYLKQCGVQYSMQHIANALKAPVIQFPPPPSAVSTTIRGLQNLLNAAHNRVLWIQINQTLPHVIENLLASWVYNHPCNLIISTPDLAYLPVWLKDHPQIVKL